MASNLQIKTRTPETKGEQKGNSQQVKKAVHGKQVTSRLDVMQ